MSEAIAAMTFAEFCELEARSEARHEFVGGRVYAMSGGSERHDLATGLLYQAVAVAAQRAGCRPFISNRMILTAAGNGYYPDLFVVCGSAVDRLFEGDATVIFEVSSPSTADVDRREKAIAYATLPSLRQYVLVDPDRRRFEVAEPSPTGLAWRSLGRGHVLFTPYADIDVDAFYDQLDQVATTT